jgi:dihydroorotase-like cyclic amidohydrolase
MGSILIRNGTIVNAESSAAADILIEGEKIREIAPSLTSPERRPRDRRIGSAAAAGRH